MSALRTDPNVFLAQIAALIHRWEAEQQPVAPVADALLDVPEAARRLGLAPITLQHRARKDPYRALLVDNGTRRLCFSADAIAVFLRERTAGGSRQPDMPGSRSIGPVPAPRGKRRTGGPAPLRPRAAG